MLVDGAFLYRPELHDVWDFRIFVDIDFDLVLERGSRRNQAWMESLAAAEHRYWTRYIPGEKIYVEAVRVERSPALDSRLIGRRVGCEPDACGCADDRAVSLRHGQGDERSCPMLNIRAESASRHRTVVPSDDNQVLEFEDVSPRVGLTGPVVEDDGELKQTA
ncbi:hypothetical protein EV648_101260 [Kribbella sp. VKM Ac-2568]|nr:hypothetical protein EV648_101260 [Kribbella sp. VKM Ac-2568]